MKNGLVSKKHAELLAGLETNGQMMFIFKKITQNNLSVRKTEEIVKKLSEVKKEIQKKKIRPLNNYSNYSHFESELCSVLGTKVSLRNKGKLNSGKGQIIIDYFSNEDFERIFELLIEKGGGI